MSESSDPADAFDAITLASASGAARVIMLKGASSDFFGLEQRQKAQLLAYMQLWTEGRPLNEKQFNGNEGRVKSTNRMLQAFKVHKVRGYGIVLPLGGRKTFVIMDWDTAKKDNKAKKRVLDRTKTKAADFEDRHGK